MLTPVSLEPKFSALMAVYHLERPESLRLSLQSLALQTLKCFELVLVKDGQLPLSLERIIEEFQPILTMRIVQLPAQGGLNIALNAGIAQCSCEIIARCDSDDISLPTRFELQYEFMHHREDIAILGCPVIEFVETQGVLRLKSVRDVPKDDGAIRRFLWWRNPFNHPTVFFRKSCVLDAGGYPERYPTKMEDYALWIRLLARGYQGHNLSEPLVLFRFGDDALRRRRGLAYFVDEIRFISEKVDSGLIPIILAFGAALIRGCIRIVPSSVLRFVYQTMLRSKCNEVKIDNETIARLGIRVAQ